MSPISDQERDRLIQAIRAKIEETNGGELIVIYDAYSSDRDGRPIDNLDEVVYHGDARIVDDDWDKYIGPPITNPTWMDVALEANKAMIANGDHHHVFLEEVYEIGLDDEGCMQLGLGLGS